METTTQLFLGVRMVCAQCHDHPFERWTQNQYFQLSAFFSAVGMKPGFDSDEQIVYLKREDTDFLHPKTNKPVQPEYLLASADMPQIGAFSDSREALAQWLTSEKNPYFAKAIVNRSGAISSGEASSSRSTTSGAPIRRSIRRCWMRSRWTSSTAGLICSTWFGPS